MKRQLEEIKITKEEKGRRRRGQGERERKKKEEKERKEEERQGGREGKKSVTEHSRDNPKIWN